MCKILLAFALIYLLNAIFTQAVNFATSEEFVSTQPHQLLDHAEGLGTIADTGEKIAMDQCKL